MVALLRDYATRKAERSPLMDTRTQREAEVLAAVAAGHSNREIAAQLYLVRAP